MLIFTSGSTGAPKAVRLTQGRAARAAMGPMGFGPDDILYCSMPVFHGNALMSMVFPSLASGASLVFKRKFSASGFLPDIRDYHCTFTSTIGRALAYILATPPTDRDRDHDLKFMLSPEASTEDMKAFRRRFGPPVFGGYGSSENAIVMMPSPGQPPEALGVPAPGLDIAVMDPTTEQECPPARFDADGRLLNADEAIGELVGRNALDRFEGYYNNDAATRERTRSGWYWSGDLAYRDAEGVFYFAGRNADWIRVDGENFAAAPVERVIQRFAGRGRGGGVRGARRPHRRRPDRWRWSSWPTGVDFDPVGLRRLPRRPARPGHQVVAPLRAGRRRAAGDGHQQDRQGAAAARPLDLDRRRSRLLAARASRAAAAADRRRTEPRSCGGSSPTVEPTC